MRRTRPAKLALRVLYWVAVVAISLALIVALILWFESQDASEIESGAGKDRSVAGQPATSRTALSLAA